MDADDYEPRSDDCDAWREEVGAAGSDQRRDSADAVAVTVTGYGHEQGEREERRNEDEVVEDDEDRLPNGTVDGSEGGKNCSKVRERRRQLDCHDSRAEQESRAGADCRLATEVRSEPVTQAPEQSGDEQERDADRELEKVPCVRGGVSEPCDDALSNREEQNEAACRRGDEHAQREQADVPGRPFAEREHGCRGDRRGVERVDRRDGEHEDR